MRVGMPPGGPARGNPTGGAGSAADPEKAGGIRFEHNRDTSRFCEPRCAKNAYQQALSHQPRCAAYAHNLGHLFDIAFNRPAAALRYLRAAHRLEPRETEIASSYAHALTRAGQPVAARRALRHALGADEAILERLLADSVRADPPGSLAD
jgi:predicted Zn-dependent protease